jgi:hypothetical protein
MFTPLPSIPDVTPPLIPTLDIVTLMAAVQTAMQPFMARLAAIEKSTSTTNKLGPAEPQLNRTQAEEQTRPAGGQPRPDRRGPAPEQLTLEEAWTQTTSRRKRGKTNPVLQQVNLTPQSYASVAATTLTPGQVPAQSPPASAANPPPTFTEVTVIRHGGAILSRSEIAVRG